MSDPSWFSEAGLRLGTFLAVLAAMAGWELAAPRRVLAQSKTARWFSNLAVAAIDVLAVRLLLPATAAGVALYAQAHGWGLLQLVAAPAWLAIVASVIVLDLVIYLQHVLFHAVPALWRVHRMHHADLDFDVTTGIRFHPIEIVLSMIVKFAAIAALGAPVAAVVLFEIALNASSLFNHGNVRLPRSLDRAVRFLFVTPDMHRVHHSLERAETNSNFGFGLSVWDRLFGSYRGAPRAGHEAMRIGIPEIRDSRHCVTLTGMLSIPFVREQAAPDDKVAAL